MNAALQALILGVVQGLTEFLPVSSSGHLVLVQSWFGADFAFSEQPILFDLVLHLGTLVPVVVFYRQGLLDLARGAVQAGGGKERRFVLCVVVATLPTAVMGLTLRDTFEGMFHNPRAVALAFLVTAGLLLLTRIARPHRALSLGIALAIGVAQGCAITPGISRSGATIATGLLLGLGREEAARFSFLLSIPAILGAMVLTAKDGVRISGDHSVALLVGFFVAAGVGYLALALLVRLVRGGRFHWFALYLIPLALFALFR